MANERTAACASNPSLLRFWALLAPLLFATLVRAAELPEAISYCLDCHGEDADTMTFEDGHEMSLEVSLDAFLASAHGGELVCTNCHRGYDRGFGDFDSHPVGVTFESRRAYVLASYTTCRSCHFDTYTRTLESIHYELLEQGVRDVPVCTDCHGAHAILDPNQKEAMVSRTCASCHPEVFETYLESVHGRALHDDSIEDVPGCVDCHTAHSIADPRTVGFHLSSPGICISCHGDEDLMSQYDISVDVATTYLADFHGVTAALADPDEVQARRLVVTCVDCHGVHDISSSDLLSAGEMKRRAEEVCFECHEGAATDFPEAWLFHYRPSLRHAPLVYLVDLFYAIFIPFVVIGLGLQVAMHFYRIALRR